MPEPKNVDGDGRNMSNNMAPIMMELKLPLLKIIHVKTHITYKGRG